MLSLRKTTRLFSALAAIVLVMQSFMSPAPAAAQDITTQATTWFVSISGRDANTCKAPAAACRTIQAAIGKAASGDTVKVTTGTYNAGSGAEVVLIGKNLTLSGGWNGAFTTQAGLSVIGGQGLRRGITTSAITTIDHFQIRNGNASQGGGIFNTGTLTLNNSSVALNQGGGITNWRILTVNYSAISANTGGGGIELRGPGDVRVTVNNSTISNNTSVQTAGAGIATVGGSASITVNNSTLSGNAPGAIWLNGSALINNSTISGNAGNWAILGVGQFLHNTTVANNWGGINVPNYVAQMTNSIVAGNSSDGGLTPNDCLGTFVSWGHNLVGSVSPCMGISAPSDLVGTDAAPLDAKLGPLADHGGPTFTHALLDGSPAIDAGNSSVEPGGDDYACLVADQRGFPRPALSEGTCDIGAFEWFANSVYSIKRMDPTPTLGDTLKFSVVFGDVVTGVDASDFAFTADPGITGASVSSVTGSRNSYVVTANAPTGTGTLRLDLVDDDSVLNAYTAEPLGGVGTGNGDFTAGEAYTLANPQVVSVTRLNGNPPTASSVAYNVSFSFPVSGVNLVAPFSDFQLVTTGLTGAAITSVTGSGTTYRVTVNIGLGSGTLGLNVVDDDTIAGASAGRPLGGPGLANGNFTGPVYTVIPIPMAPTATTWDTTPTFQWTKLAGVPQYRYQLFRGTTLTYSNTMLAAACGASFCFNTPATQLAPGYYKWHVQAMVGGNWKAYGPYLAFTIKAPQAGYYKGLYSDYAVDFYVTPNRVSVDHFGLWFFVDGCGKSYKVVLQSLLPINSSGEFSFTTPAHDFYGTGAFADTSLNPMSASGAVVLDHYYLSGCGAVSGYANWVANWVNGSQPADAAIQDPGSVGMTPMMDTPFDYSLPSTFTVQP